MQSKEIEFKTLLTKEEFDQVVAHYALTEDTRTVQTNYYFDTPDQQLKNRHWGLRIRTYPTHAEQTLKVPSKVGLWEITDELDLREAATLTATGKIKDHGQIAEKLSTEAILLPDLILLASLKTARWEFDTSFGLLALDESWYGNQHDYEMELEVTDFAQGRQDFHKLLHSLNLTYRPGDNKIARAIKEK